MTQRRVSDGASHTRLHPLPPLDVADAHDVVGLLGPNGAGKGTMLRLLATAMPPTSGRIVVAGHQVTVTIAERTAARRAMGTCRRE